ncbi:MAG: VOC family protein [Gammaproteobacteria bacterium]|jgi:extradiol dioxygenase family protein
MSLSPFHLALPVTDLIAARTFYVDLLGCGTGREDERWLDLDFFGHQVTLHLAEGAAGESTNAVDGDRVPVRHFGVILPLGEWQTLAERLRASGVAFLIEPRVRFRGRPGEQHTMFLRDPCGNALEFKSFADPGQVFATG